MSSLLVSTWIKFFFLLTPSFAVTMFLSLTGGRSPKERSIVALRVTFAVAVVSVVLFFAGNTIFEILGITLDSFRVGGGALLFVSAVTLIYGGGGQPAPEEDMAVVPLAIPVIVGPATTGAILVMGAEMPGAGARLMGLAGLLLAVLCVGLVLLAANQVERVIKRRGIQILTKLTGLVVAAIAAQMVFEGAKNLLR